MIVAGIQIHKIRVFRGLAVDTTLGLALLRQARTVVSAASRSVVFGHIRPRANDELTHTDEKPDTEIPPY